VTEINSIGGYAKEYRSRRIRQAGVLRLTLADVVALERNNANVGAGYIESAASSI
jgi:cobalt-zinc-cadmium resistance protein CzcA